MSLGACPISLMYLWFMIISRYIIRVDGVVGYRICLTSVHRRSSVRTWVDSFWFLSLVFLIILIMYLYELPTTGAISFSDFCLDQSAGRVTSIGILQATEARANLRQALKKCKRAEDGTRDYLSLTKVSNLD